jgi:SAM-dependent methyltransferase
MARLNLGAGNRPEPGAVNHDRIRHRPEIDVVHDLDVLPWPWPDNSFDAITARSVLEHLRLNLVESVDECWRILQPGGCLHVKVPLWTHENSYADPTHHWHYTLHSFDVFDPSTKLGTELDFYTSRKWDIVRGPITNEPECSGVYVTMRVRK